MFFCVTLRCKNNKKSEHTEHLCDNKLVMLGFIKRYPLSLAITAAILYLSFFKPPKQEVITIEYLDKIAHFCMYAGLCTIVWLEYFLSHEGVSRVRTVCLAVVAPIIFSGAIELGQGYLTTYRGIDIYDFIFNSIGVLAALLFAKFVMHPWVKSYKAKRRG